MARTRKPCPGCGASEPYAWREVGSVCGICKKKLAGYDALKNILQHGANREAFLLERSWARVYGRWTHGMGMNASSKAIDSLEAALDGVLQSVAIRTDDKYGRHAGVNVESVYSTEAEFVRVGQRGNYDNERLLFRGPRPAIFAIIELRRVIGRALKHAHAAGKREGADEIHQHTENLESELRLLVGRAYRAGQRGEGEQRLLPAPAKEAATP